ncbi:hypothetical protein NQ318_010838 [Aromia moschata]|uniref:Uncharacterized protein n=1 Tax=Aromia moschata TaxID=1265417 RepID=A0AAV8YHC8_9CUCU|nr:hypothetical protein NQ318_010838 [Aromia moschata]
MNSISCLILSLFVGIQCCGDFYWREFEGVIPTDAISFGYSDFVQKQLYIGQAYIHNYGLMIGKIYNGAKQITVPCYGTKTTNTAIKILCAQDSRKYYWLSTTNETYSTDTANKCPVLGGYDETIPDHTNLTHGVLHIGRINYLDDYVTGNIAAYHEYPLFYYVLNNVEKNSAVYEVLMYSDNPIQTP